MKKLNSYATPSRTQYLLNTFVQHLWLLYIDFNYIIYFAVFSEHAKENMNERKEKAILDGCVQAQPIKHLYKTQKNHRESRLKIEVLTTNNQESNQDSEQPNNRMKQKT